MTLSEHHERAMTGSEGSHVKRSRRFLEVMVGGGLLLCLLAVAGIAISSTSIPFSHVVSVLGSKILPSSWFDLEGIREVDQQIIWTMRTPRVILAGLVGAMLALSGVQLQGLFRNPLAAPGLIGTSQGAALGAVIAISVGLAARSVVYIPLFSFLGALFALLIIASLAARDGRTSVAMLLLGGIALNFLLSAGVSLTISLVWKYQWETSVQIMIWLMGSLEGRSWLHVGIAGFCFIVSVLFATWFARDLDLMLEGEDSARSLGVETEKVKMAVLLVTALLTGGAVAVSGVVGFVGLVIPHMVRLLLGPSHRTLNPACAVTGAWFLIGADLLARTVIRPEEIRLGIVTAVIGAPFFLYLLMRLRREMELL